MTPDEQNLIDALRANVAGKETLLKKYQDERIQMARDVIHWKTLVMKLENEMAESREGGKSK